MLTELIHSSKITRSPIQSIFGDVRTNISIEAKHAYIEQSEKKTQNSTGWRNRKKKNEYKKTRTVPHISIFSPLLSIQ